MSLEETKKQLDAQRQAQLMEQIRRLGVGDDDPLFAVLAAIGYHRLLIEDIPQRIAQASLEAQGRVETAISLAAQRASLEASEDTKQEFSEFAKKAIALAVERSQKYAHNPDAQQAKNQGYRWIVGTAVASLILGFALGWLSHSTLNRTQVSQATALKPVLQQR